MDIRKKIFSLNFIIFIIIICLYNHSYAEVIDQALVIVEDDVITDREFALKKQYIVTQYKLSGQEFNETPEFNSQLLNHMIQIKLQENYARRVGIEVSDEMVNNALLNMAKRTNSNLQTFKEELEKQGVNFNNYRNEIKTGLLTKAVEQNFVRANVKVADREIDAFVSNNPNFLEKDTEFLLSNILITKKTSRNNEEILKKIKSKLNQGAKFSSLAMSFSESGNALDGGSLGWRIISDIPDLFKESLQDIEIGESKVIETEESFHIIFLEDKKSMGGINLTEFHSRHILIKESAILGPTEAESKLLDIRNRIINGEDFSTLAQAHSEDKVSAANGGDLGWTMTGALVPVYEKNLLNLKTNEISKPFKTKFGWHITQLLGKRDSHNLDKVMRNIARQKIVAEKGKESYNTWLSKLRGSSYIRYVLPEFNEAQREIDNRDNWDPFS